MIFFSHGALLSDRIRKKIAVMAARGHRKTCYVEQTKKMVPVVTSETLFGHHVCEFFVNIFDLDLWFQIDSVKQPIKRNSVGSGRVSLLDLVLC